MNSFVIYLAIFATTYAVNGETRHHKRSLSHSGLEGLELGGGFGGLSSGISLSGLGLGSISLDGGLGGLIQNSGGAQAPIISADPAPAPSQTYAQAPTITRNILTTVNRQIPVPYPVRVAVPHPVAVPVPQPYPVHVYKPYPVAVDRPVPVPQPVAVPVTITKTVPVTVLQPYPVAVQQQLNIPAPTISAGRSYSLAELSSSSSILGGYGSAASGLHGLSGLSASPTLSASAIKIIQAPSLSDSIGYGSHFGQTAKYLKYGGYVPKFHL